MKYACRCNVCTLVSVYNFSNLTYLFVYLYLFYLPVSFLLLCCCNAFFPSWITARSFISSYHTVAGTKNRAHPAVVPAPRGVSPGRACPCLRLGTTARWGMKRGHGSRPYADVTPCIAVHPTRAGGRGRWAHRERSVRGSGLCRRSAEHRNPRHKERGEHPHMVQPQKGFIT